MRHCLTQYCIRLCMLHGMMPVCIPPRPARARGRPRRAPGRRRRAGPARRGTRRSRGRTPSRATGSGASAGRRARRRPGRPRRRSRTLPRQSGPPWWGQRLRIPCGVPSGLGDDADLAAVTRATTRPSRSRSASGADVEPAAQPRGREAQPRAVELRGVVVQDLRPPGLGQPVEHEAGVVEVPVRVVGGEAEVVGRAGGLEHLEEQRRRGRRCARAAASRSGRARARPRSACARATAPRSGARASSCRAARGCPAARRCRPRSAAPSASGSARTFRGRAARRGATSCCTPSRACATRCRR